MWFVWLTENGAKGLTNQPHAIKVVEVEGERTSVIELSVAKEDMGKVIGKQGRTAIAMRTFLNAAGMKQKKKNHIRNHRIGVIKTPVMM